MSVIADFAAYLTGFAKDPLHSWVPWPAQQRAIDCKAFELLWGGSAGGGKMLSLRTEVPTPDGFVCLGELEPGDNVLGERGQPVRVLAVHPIDPRPVSYQVVFDDGSVVEACEDHLWATVTSNGPEAVRSTAEIARTIATPTGLANHAVRPVSGLGDAGTFHTGRFRYVLYCRKVPPVPMRCITVDNPTGLYLVTRSFIPTHNTDLVLYTARLHHRSSLILRRTYPELEDTIIKRILERDQAHYNSSKHIWMPDPGRRVRLGSCELEKDAYKYLGGEYDLFAPDELTQFTETQYLQILSRVRSTDRSQRCRVLATTNPGGENEAWVLRRWGPWLDKNHPDRAADGEVRWYKRGHGDEDIRCESDDPDGESRSFIQARLADNPALAGDGKYRRALMQLPEVRRRQLLDGDWTAGSSDVERQVIPTEWIKAAMARWTASGAGLGPVTAVGVDVARGGRDRTVLAPRWGNWFGEILSYPGSATTTGDELADLVMPLVTDDKGRLHGYVAVDGIGVGSSAYDTLRGRGVEAWAVMAGSTTNDGERFFDRARVQRLFNMRAAVWWNLREALDPEKGDGVQLPFDPELLADLQAPRYLDKGGGVALEPKDKIRERIGRSPDKGDAVAMALYPRFGTTGAVAVPMRQRAPIAVVQSASVMRTGGVGAVRWGAF